MIRLPLVLLSSDKINGIVSNSITAPMLIIPDPVYSVYDSIVNKAIKIGVIIDKRSN